MAAMKLFLQLVLAFVLSANHKSEAQTLRKLGKPALQTLSMYETVSCFTGVFNGPADTWFGFDDTIFKVKKEENYVLTAHYKTDKPHHTSRHLTIKSNSTRETVQVIIEPKTESRTQITFPVNDCQIGIEEYEFGTQTIYNARVKNCDGLENRWHINLLPWWPVNVTYDPRFSENPKYVKTSTKFINDLKDTYSIILNNSAMHHDGITIRKLFFSATHWNSSPNDIAPVYQWTYDI